MPVLHLSYPYGAGKHYDLVCPLPIRRSVGCARGPAPRLDGDLNDRCWKQARPVSGFGRDDGGACPVEPLNVYFAHDDSLLFIGVRCSEARISALKTAATERDSIAPDDDHLDFLFQPNPDSATTYELIINPDGTVWDCKYRTENGRSLRDRGWNGNWRVARGRGSNFWTLEIEIPLADFPSRSRTWGFNVARYQSRFGRTGVLQTPFAVEPNQFGRLEFSN